jgi:hypothetical protein
MLIVSKQEKSDLRTARLTSRVYLGTDEEERGFLDNIASARLFRSTGFILNVPVDL